MVNDMIGIIFALLLLMSKIDLARDHNSYSSSAVPYKRIYLIDAQKKKNMYMGHHVNGDQILISINIKPPRH